ncbi:methyltransferase domain-containing protein, partial [Thermodesulfobacteriota bacterium]
MNYFSEEIKTEGLSNNIRIRKTAYDPFVFEDDEFDLVVCRGVFFFLDENGRLFMEIFRVLREGGMAFIGGGYGKDAPREVIDEIADESRKLNDR